ncbi:MAG: hypothetical protein ACE5OZ_18635 [Candidatus Heimdallarchaeota archaeon]
MNQWDVLELVFMSLSIVVLSLIALKRVVEINELSKEANFFLFSPIYLTAFAILFSSAILSYAITSSFPEVPLPFATWSIPLSLILLLFIYALSQDRNILFIIPVKLHAVIVTDQRSGLVMYAESFAEGAPAEDLLGGLFTALNISLKETIQSQKDLEEIAFGDKVVHIAPGHFATTFFITSEKTLMSSVLSSYLTKSFEKAFKTLIASKSNIGLKIADFRGFATEIQAVKQYFAV